MESVKQINTQNCHVTFSSVRFTIAVIHHHLFTHRHFAPFARGSDLGHPN